MLDWAPGRVQANAAAALAVRSAEAMSAERLIAAINTPQKVSPAAVVSTAATGSRAL